MAIKLSPLFIGRGAHMEYLKMNNITMKFPGVVALDNVSFDLRLGEVHVLLGENGAGKSTLVKILSGIYTPTSGEITISGRPVSDLTPKGSADNKIAIIYQELSIVDNLSIAENMFLGKLPTKKKMGITVVDKEFLYAESEKYLKEIGLKKNPSTLVQDISISEKQQVEIAKALCSNAKVIIMDEPTSSLSIDETKNMFRIIEHLKKNNIGIIYISHKLPEIKEIGDRVTILKDGKYVKTLNISDLEVKDLVPLMIGREIKDKFVGTKREIAPDEQPTFVVKNLTRKDGTCRNINFEVYKGEILGFAGLIGAGRSECMEGIFGAKTISSGEVYYNGKKLKIHNPYDAMKQGIAMVTENRRETGFFPNFPIWKEIAVSTSLKKSTLGGFTGMVQTKSEKNIAEKFTKKLSIKCTGVNQMTYNLSGGNQQKVIISKWLAVDSNIFIFDEPTKGIDVGAKSEIYAIMRSMAEEGKTIIMVSSEMPELLSTCDRIIVFRDGEISGIFNSDEATEEKIMLAAVHLS